MQIQTASQKNGEPKAYLVDAHEFRMLKDIEKRLFGNGAHWTPDDRLDLANKMNVILGRIANLPVDLSDDPA